MSLHEKDLVSTLPDTFKIKERPLHIGTSNPIYAKIIETLKVMAAEKCIEIPMKEVKTCFNSMLKATARKANLDFIVKIARDGKNWVVWRGVKFPDRSEV